MSRVSIVALHHDLPSDMFLASGTCRMVYDCKTDDLMFLTLGCWWRTDHDYEAFAVDPLSSVSVPCRNSGNAISHARE